MSLTCDLMGRYDQNEDLQSRSSFLINDVILQIFHQQEAF